MVKDDSLFLNIVFVFCIYLFATRLQLQKDAKKKI